VHCPCRGKGKSVLYEEERGGTKEGDLGESGIQNQLIRTVKERNVQVLDYGYYLQSPAELKPEDLHRRGGKVAQRKVARARREEEETLLFSLNHSQTFRVGDYARRKKEGRLAVDETSRGARKKVTTFPSLRESEKKESEIKEYL